MPGSSPLNYYSSPQLSSLFYLPQLVMILLWNHGNHPTIADAACPTLFYAQAISAQRAALLNLYFTKVNVKSAADCATYCGNREYCRTAVYNHEALTCSFSFAKFTECLSSKHRYNSFHLTADGAEPLSVLACIDHCRQEKTPQEDYLLLADRDAERDGGGFRRRTIHPTSLGAIFDSEPARVDKIDQGHSTANHPDSFKIGLTPIPLSPIFDYRYPPPSSSSRSKLAQMLYSLVPPPKAGSTHTAIVRVNESISVVEAADGNATRVFYHAHPLGIRESLHGAESLQEAMAPTPSSTTSKILNQTRTYTEETELIVQEGGLLKRFRPWERITVKPASSLVLIPTWAKKLSENVNGVASTLPPPDVKTMTAEGRIFVQSETQSSSKTHPPFVYDSPNLAPLETTTIAFAPSTAKPANIKTWTTYGMITVHNDSEQSSSNLTDPEPVVVDGHILNPKQAQDLISRERTSSTTTTTAAPWSPAGLIGGDTTAAARNSSRQPSGFQDDHGFLNTFVLRGLSSMLNGEKRNYVDGQKEKGGKNVKPRATTPATRTTTTTTTMSSQAPLVCYRYVPQQQLLYASYRRVENISLNDCRCLCAESWRPSASTLPVNRCKSLQYRAPNKDRPFSLCVLNKADHNGKYDLIYDTVSDYHYVSCNTQVLLETAEKMCGQSGVAQKGRDGASTKDREASTTTEKGLTKAEEGSTHRDEGRIGASRGSTKDSEASSTTHKGLSKVEEGTTDRDEGRIGAGGESAIASEASSTTHKGLSKVEEGTTDRDKTSGGSTLASGTSTTTHKGVTKTEEGSNPSNEGRIGASVGLTRALESLTTTDKALIIPEEGSSGHEEGRTGPERGLDETRDSSTPTNRARSDTETSPESIVESSTMPLEDHTTITQIPIETITSAAGAASTSPETGSSAPTPASKSTSLPTSKASETTPEAKHDEAMSSTAASVTENTTTGSLAEGLKSTLIGTTKTISTNLTVESDQVTTKPTPTPMISGCFEHIAGWAMNSTAGGLERDVSIEECQCHCANSLAWLRYSFQCTSANYYPKERDCILNLGNRQLSVENFVENAPASGYKEKGLSTPSVTYLGLTCPIQKALETHSEECNKLNRNPFPTTITPTTTITTKPARNSDECFLELPNYVLEGTALAIETNATVEECKCYCMDSESRYGTECLSLQYYYDSATCLLNKENRQSDAERFTYDSGSNVMHSYFDYRCHVEKVVMSAYIEQSCQMVAQMTIRDVLQGKSTTAVATTTTTAASTTSTSTTTTTTTAPPLNANIDATSSELAAAASNQLKSGRDMAAKAGKGDYAGKAETLAPPKKTTTKKPPSRRKKAKSGSRRRHPHRQHSSSTTAPSVVSQSTQRAPKTTSTPTITTTTTRPFIPEMEGMEEGGIDMAVVGNEIMSDSVSSTLTSTTTSPNTTAATSMRPEVANLLPSTTTAKPFPYPPVGPCRFSALYQTIFNGNRRIKQLSVDSPAQCFAACHAERCRSANLIQLTDGGPKGCELFKDSIVDFRRTDVLAFDHSAVHFESIQCEEAIGSR